MRKEQSMPVNHPTKVDAVIDQRGHPADFPIVAKALTRREHATEQQCRIYGRDFAVPSTSSGFCIQPVIEPSMFLKSFSSKESQCITRALTCLSGRDPLALGRNA